MGNCCPCWSRSDNHHYASIPNTGTPIPKSAEQTMQSTATNRTSQAPCIPVDRLSTFSSQHDENSFAAVACSLHDSTPPPKSPIPLYSTMISANDSSHAQQQYNDDEEEKIAISYHQEQSYYGNPKINGTNIKTTLLPKLTSAFSRAKVKTPPPSKLSPDIVTPVTISSVEWTFTECGCDTEDVDRSVFSTGPQAAFVTLHKESNSQVSQSIDQESRSGGNDYGYSNGYDDNHVYHIEQDQKQDEAPLCAEGFRLLTHPSADHSNRKETAASEVSLTIPRGQILCVTCRKSLPKIKFSLNQQKKSRGKRPAAAKCQECVAAVTAGG